MLIEIVTPEKTLFKGEASGVKMPGEAGRFEVLEGHAPIITTLVAGEICVSGAETFQVSIASGFAEVAENHVLICCEATE